MIVPLVKYIFFSFHDKNVRFVMHIREDPGLTNNMFSISVKIKRTVR